jgi:hypothetical protein
MTSPLEILQSAAPIRVPVSENEYGEFFGCLIQYLDSPDLIRMIYDVFGPHVTARLISVFHGLTLQIRPRDFWMQQFRAIHIYLELSRVPAPKENQDLWRGAVVRLARTYQITPRNVVETFFMVRSKIRKKEGAA